MIHITLTGGFGNHLLAYIAGRIIAYKYNVSSNNISIHVGYNVLEKHKNSNYSIWLKDTCDSILKIIDKNIEIISYEKNNFKKISLDEFNDLEKNIKFKQLQYNIFMCGILPDMHLLSLYKEKIKNEWLNFNYEYNGIIPSKNDIVLTVRLGFQKIEGIGPYSQNYHRIPPNFYITAINLLIETKKLENNNIIICCDNFDDDYLKSFDIYPNMFYAKYNTLDQFKLLLLSNNIVCSNSTFSLVACVLSNAESIIYPKFKKSNSMFNNIESEDNSIYARFYPREERDQYIMIE